MQRTASKPAFAFRQARFRELARLKAERDCEPPSWTESEVLKFETEKIAPAKTGAELNRLVRSVLEDIQMGLRLDDVSSRPLLQRAESEEEVRDWLVEQLNFRARGRYHAFREAEVARGNKPDVIVASTAGQVEVALEVKHGGKDWSLRDFERSLRGQLAQEYLKPLSRRHGILLISNHGRRHWRHPEKGKLSFSDLIEWLQSIAITIDRNDAGAVSVSCVGIDATKS